MRPVIEILTVQLGSFACVDKFVLWESILQNSELECWILSAKLSFMKLSENESTGCVRAHALTQNSLFEIENLSFDQIRNEHNFLMPKQ